METVVCFCSRMQKCIGEPLRRLPPKQKLRKFHLFFSACGHWAVWRPRGATAGGAASARTAPPSHFSSAGTCCWARLWAHCPSRLWDHGPSRLWDHCWARCPLPTPGLIDSKGTRVRLTHLSSKWINFFVGSRRCLPAFLFRFQEIYFFCEGNHLRTCSSR